MKQKKDLAKVALAALIFAAAAPADAIDHGIEAQGTYLASGCAAHGCKTIADNAGSDNEMYNTRSNTYQMGNQPSGSGAQNGDRSRAMSTTAPASAMNETQLLGMLNPQTQNIYLSLDPEGKALALQLASQDSYRDKNLAVKEAQRRMNERRGVMNH